MSLLTRHAAGLVIVGDDLVIVRARVRGLGLEWESRRIAGAMSQAASEEALAAARSAAEETVRGQRVLVIPTDTMLRRDIEPAGRTLDELRSTVAENLESFLPAPADDALLWDLCPLGRRAWLGGAPESELAPTLARLDELGLAPTLAAPSGSAWGLGLRVAEMTGGESRAILEITPTGWGWHTYEGLAWTSCRAGVGAPPAQLLAEAASGRAARCDWSAASAVGSIMTAEHAALGGALLAACPRVSQGHEPPRFNLLPHPTRRRFTLGFFGRWAAVAAVATAGSVALGDALKQRADRECVLIETVGKEAKTRADAVERMRKQSERLIAGHDRLWRLESAYIPRAAILAALSEATPREVWVERLEITDGSFSMDLVGKGSAEVIRAVGAHGAFENVRQTTAEVVTDRPGESRFRVEGRIVPAAFRGSSAMPAAAPAVSGDASPGPDPAPSTGGA